MKKAQATRLMILQKAFELIYAKGYQTTSIDDILETTQVTKGAFYYHFKNKNEMGIAIINELMKPALTSGFETILAKSKSPIDGIYDLMHHLLVENDFLKVEYGCPAANFTYEMTPWNAEFSKALHEIINQWNQTMVDLIESGKKSGLVNESVNAEQATLFVMSGYWGVRNFAKLENSKSMYLFYLKELKKYLQLLR